MPLPAESRLNGSLRAPRRPDGPAHQAGALADEEIVRRVLEGDLPSFELIMRRYNQRLFRIVRSMLGDDDEAEDVVQETYVRVFEHLSEFAGRSRFSTWLTRIAIHEASFRRRRRRRMRPTDLEGSEHLHPVAAGQFDGGRETDMRELHDVLARAVEALPDELRTVFILRVVEGIDTLEAAECLDLTESNVKVRLHRARALLRAWIDRKLGAEVRRLYQFDGERCDRIVRAVLDRLACR